MTEERFETDTILRGTTAAVDRPVEVDADGNPIETETVELPANERIEVVTCERYPSACPRDAGWVPTEEAVVVGVDVVDRATGTESAVALAYCPECAAAEFGYVRGRDGPRDADGRTLSELYGYCFDDRDGGRTRGLVGDVEAGITEAAVLLFVFGGFLLAVGANWLVVWAVLATTATASLLAVRGG